MNNRLSILKSLTVALCLIANAVTWAQPSAEEIWFGTLDVRVARLRLEFRIVADETGKLSGKMISLDQGSTEIVATTIERRDGQLIMKFPSVAGEFVGTFNDAGDVARGTWKQVGNEYPLEIRRTDRVPQRQHIESWQGVLKAAGQEFEFQIRIFLDDQQTRSAVLDSFSELFEGLSLDLTESKDSIEFVVLVSNAKFVGQRSADGEQLVGHWLQRGGRFPLTFSKVTLEQTRSLSLKRPQTPQPPFDYSIVELTIPIAGGQYELSGTLTHPHGNGPFPVAVLISGSGPQDRDETIFDHKPFWVIADHLTTSGFAVFRYDERGVGKSTGVFAEATTRDFANDIVDIVRYLSGQQVIDAGRIVLIGHSEGAIIAPMVAAENTNIAGIVMMAGPGVPGRQIVLNQTRLIGKAAGMNDAALDAQQQMLVRLLSPDINTEDALKNAFLDGIKQLQGTLPDEMQQTQESFETLIGELLPSVTKQFQSKWFQYFLDYDPAPALAKIKVPVLVMIGDKDLQVDPDLNLPVIETQLKKAGNRDVVIKRFDNLNHLFQTCTSGEPREYAVIEETFAPIALESLSQWLVVRFIPHR
ncbi:MAG TPA: alpha/beta fold hydrolase [Pirellulaceae bacterium]|nr:alpha/beta fold hydrolase [Pirellulaceae bacterium]